MFNTEDSHSAEESCQDILQTLRSSSLIYFVQESAYSAYITIRKRYRKEIFKKPVDSQSEASKHADIKALDNLKHAHENLIKSYEILQHKFEETITECEELHRKVTENDVKVANLHQKLTEAEIEIREKNSVKTKSAKLMTENKSLRNEKDELVKQSKAVNVALKSSQKDLNDSTHRYKKKIEELDAKIEDLTKFKILKNSEEKELRNMKKKAEKKLKDVREKEVKLKVDQNYFDKNHKHLYDDNNSELGDDNHNLKYSNTLSPSESPPQVFSVRMHSSYTSSNMTTYPSMLSHWLPLPKNSAVYGNPPSFISHSINSASAKPSIIENVLKPFIHRVSRSRVWKCDLCEQTYPSGYTMDQALHVADHRKRL